MRVRVRVQIYKGACCLFMIIKCTPLVWDFITENVQKTFSDSAWGHFNLNWRHITSFTSWLVRSIVCDATLLIDELMKKKSNTDTVYQTNTNKLRKKNFHRDECQRCATHTTHIEWNTIHMEWIFNLHYFRATK